MSAVLPLAVCFSRSAFGTARQSRSPGGFPSRAFTTASPSSRVSSRFPPRGPRGPRRPSFCCCGRTCGRASAETRAVRSFVNAAAPHNPPGKSHRSAARGTRGLVVSQSSIASRDRVWLAMRFSTNSRSVGSENLPSPTRASNCSANVSDGAPVRENSDSTILRARAVLVPTGAARINCTPRNRPEWYRYHASGPKYH